MDSLYSINAIFRPSPIGWNFVGCDNYCLRDESSETTVDYMISLGLSDRGTIVPRIGPRE